ncbi:BCCT family transporter [Blautia luti]|nr:BCCT family transporter [Blautia luti]
MFWAVLFSVLAVAIMIVGGLESVKIMSVVTGLLLILVLVLLMISVKKRLEEHISKSEKRRE